MTLLLVTVLALVVLGAGAFLMNSAAVAGASTQTAQAMAALPTATPMPPSATASPTETPWLPTDTPQPTATLTLNAGTTRVSPSDGMVLVYMPAGEFLMGSTEAEIAQAVKKYPASFFGNEQPKHTVYLDAYWIDRTVVTNAQYARCVKAGQCPSPQATRSHKRDHYYGNVRYANYPVIYVTWSNAENYCGWAGRRLPTEAEWEKAARGTDGRIYPWGNQAPDTTLANFDENVNDTTEVGKYPAGASPYGVLDMAGNVWQWVADWYDENYYQNSPGRNPTGPASGSLRVMRGGAFYFDSSAERSAGRLGNGPDVTWDPNGFRCATTVP
jgi:formylglycine-generating enzyme required for sulfatase activity